MAYTKENSSLNRFSDRAIRLLWCCVTFLFCMDTSAQETTETGKIPQPAVYEKQFFSPLYNDAFFVKEDTLLLASSKDRSLYFYVRQDSTWKLAEQVTLTEPVGAFGQSVDWNGNYIVVGDPVGVGNPKPCKTRGTVYVFRRSAGKWSLDQQLRSPKDEPDRFGSFVQLTDRFLIVAAPQRMNCTETALSGESTSISRSYIYELKKGKWELKQQFPADEPAYYFGQVRLTAQNELLMPKDTKIYVFRLLREEWMLADSIFREGHFLHLQDYNDRYLVAKDNSDVSVFERDVNGHWNYLQTFPKENPGGSSTYYGAVGVIGQDEIAVSAPSERAIWGDQGKVYVYRKGPKGLFEKIEVLKASDGLKGDCFGKKVFFSGNDLIVMTTYDHLRILAESRGQSVNTYPGDIYYYRR